MLGEGQDKAEEEWQIKGKSQKANTCWHTPCNSRNQKASGK